MIIKCIDVQSGKTHNREFTEEELLDRKAASVSDESSITYARKREAEYPPIGDQLDAIMKWVAGENEITVSPELKSIAQVCMDIKAKYPKKD